MRSQAINFGSLLPFILSSTLWLTAPAIVEAGYSQEDYPEASSLIGGADGCDHVISTDVSTANGRTNYSSVSPGDTVCIVAGTRNYLTLRNFEGTPEEPITFINYGGQVVINGTRNSHGILIQNSRYFHLTGTGHAGTEYGFKIIFSYAVGVQITNKSTNLEVDHIEISGVPIIGIMAKTEGVCSDGSTNDFDYDGDGYYEGDLDDVVNQSNFVQRETVLHHNYVHDVGTEGFYVGSSFYSREKWVSCTSGWEKVYNPVLTGVYIYNNRVEDTGWDGIQVGSAIERCGIHHNQIYRDSQEVEQDQESGIMNNPGSVCDIYNNFIKDGGGPGMYVQGNGQNRIYNNVIVNPGQNGKGFDGITIATGSNSGNSTFIWDNTVVNPYDYGINFHNDSGSQNRIQNNIVVDPEGRYVGTGGRTNVIVSDNLGYQNVSEVGFTAPTADDYSIQAYSPAVDAGINLSSEGISVDYRDERRPQGGAYDIGAYELVPEEANTPTPTNTPSPTYTPTPSPTNTPTNTLVPLPTNTPTATHTPTPANTPTPLPTNTPTITYTPTPTNTPMPLLTNTPTPTYTPTPLPTNSPSPTFTSLPPRHTPTPMPLPTDTPMPPPTSTIEPAYRPTLPSVAGDGSHIFLPIVSRGH